MLLWRGCATKAASSSNAWSTLMNEQYDRGFDRLMHSVLLLAAIHREGSFAAAAQAQALDLDPSSVSHRVRALQEYLGLSLFARTTRRVRPTGAGAILCAGAVRSAEEMQRALAAARAVGTASESGLRLSVTSSVAMKWLVPGFRTRTARG